MLLNSITLKNIRSYKDQTINFQEGITLLAGDIGSGKSTILHSIEFALFGASRPDLPAESLLRKGESKASVTLEFTINNQTFTIHRTLQNAKQGARDLSNIEIKDVVRQGTGYIIQNNQKFEYTAIELKAKIIEILGYPSELITRGKNYVYRYTIYCPQEEMKQILLESADNRLEILRKIFNVEKYKRVRDNIIIYLRELRKEITILQTRCETLPQKEEDFLICQDVLKQSQEKKQLLEKQAIEAQEIFISHKQLLDSVKQSMQERQKFQHELSLIQKSQSDLTERQSQLAEKITRLKQQRKSLLIDNTNSAEKIDQEIISIQEKLDKIQTKKRGFESLRDQLQSHIKELQSDLLKSKEFTLKLNSLADKIAANNLFLVSNKDLFSKKEKLEQKTHSFMLNKTQIQTQLSQLIKREDKFTSLTECPTCEQAVSGEHCVRIKEQITKELAIFKQSLENILKEESTVKVQLDNLNLELIHLQKIEQEQNILLQEQASLQAYLSLHQQTQVKLKETVARNNSLMTEYQEFLQLELPLQEDFKKRSISLQKQKEQIFLANQLELQESELVKEQASLSQRFKGQQESIISLESKLKSLPNLEEKLLKLENSLELARFSLDAIKIELSKQGQIVINQKQTFDSLNSELNSLRITKKNLLAKEELARWIDRKFIPLAGHIEKEIMFKIYHYCNELFSEWFEMLTEGSELSARLDSEFAPVIEQQGHEIAFAYLSGGERTAASLAYRLALTKAINGVMQEINTKELLILDEPTDGFSRDQLQRLRDCLEAIGLKQILIVSHEAMMEGFVNHIINIEKKSGVSYLC